MLIDVRDAAEDVHEGRDVPRPAGLERAERIDDGAHAFDVAIARVVRRTQAQKPQ